MFQFIDNLRLKPEAIRRRYALGVSIALIGFISVFWVSSLVTKFTIPDEQTAAVASETPVTPSIKANIAQSYKQVKDAINSSNDSLKNTMGNNDSGAAPSADGTVIITDPNQ